MKKIILLALSLTMAIGLAACSRPADVASHNLSKQADNFEIERRIVFYNGITGGYMLSLIGRCALGNYDSNGQLTVTCKTGPDSYKKHFLGLSDNVTYFVEQLRPVKASVYRYKVYFNPSTILPDVDVVK